MVIFLDIDGVLNQLQLGYKLDINCIKVLAELCKFYKAKIVLTSSWRMGYLHDYNRSSKQIQELIDLLANYDIQIIGRTGNLGSRADEILEYLNTHRVINYLILDDDISEFNRMLPNLYIVNSRTGLVQSDIKKIKKIIRR